MVRKNWFHSIYLFLFIFIDNSDDQQQNNKEFELMCRQITDNAIGDNGKNLIFD